MGPTTRPTSAPTWKPSPKPTRKPSSAPTRKPSSAPTRKPSSSPTRPPTNGPSVKRFVWHSTTFIRVQVKGVMNRHNLLHACKRLGLVPLCDHPHWNDNQCYVADGQRSWHLSYPPQDRHYGIPVNEVRGAFFYTGGAHVGAIQNPGRTHRWANGGD